MRKRWIVISMSLSIVAGLIASYTVSHFVSDDRTGSDNKGVMYTDENAIAHFVSSPSGTTQGILPDFTTAAEHGVEAVVNIENWQKQKSQPAQHRGRGVDPFELFFGPQQRPQSQPPQQRSPSQSQQPKRRSGGSGVIISTDGYIVSNHHVIDDADRLTVVLHDGTTHQARLVGSDPSTDIALLKIEAEGLKTIPFGNSDELRIGEWVLAVGNPYGLTSTVTAGIVSAKGRSLGMISSQVEMGIESFIQTDAVVNPGNSGGALITTEGLLIGINTLIKSPTGTYAGYSFAVPSSIVRKVVADLREYGVVQRAMLGIMFQAITSDWVEEFGEQNGITEQGGIYIAEVTEQGAAEVAGIKSGDVLTQIGGKPINTTAQVQETIAKLRPNDNIKVTIVRGGSVKEFDVTLLNRAGKTEMVSKDDVNLLDELGATFREVTDKQMRELGIQGGIQVVQLKADGLLARSRVQRGYIITAINDMSIESVADLNRITDNVQSIDGVYPDGRIVSYQALAR